MDIIRNFPAISLIISMGAAIVSSALSGKWARRLCYSIVSIVGVLSFSALRLCQSTGISYVYKMGRFSAPWGNEIRFGVLECFIATFFCVIMLFALIGGAKHLLEQVDPFKENLYYVLLNLLLASLLALVYTNDMFTAYVFVEINTISGCGLIMIRERGKTLEAAVRYMIMSLIGSGMFLFGLCIIYDITGQLLMQPIHEAVNRIYANGQYDIPLTVAIVFMGVGLAVKSALFPFHSWVPDAYGYSTTSSAAILSSLVSKGYIVLLVKIVYRVIGYDVINASGLLDVLFVFGLFGMIAGSIGAIRENNISRMIAYSSVAQIGYIYMGIGLATESGMIASIFHILSHSATKCLLFIASYGLIEASGDSRKFVCLTGSGYRNKMAGIAFTIGSLSMVGVPLFAGFISKILFAQSAIRDVPIYRMMPTLICLALSTILNVIYFMKTVIRIYTPDSENTEVIPIKKNIGFAVACVLLIGVNVFLGLRSEGIVAVLKAGLEMLS